MFDTISSNETIDLAPLTTFGDLRSFAGVHRDALLDAAGLLGASPGIRLAQRAIDGLAEPGTPSRRTMRAFGELLDLLMLEHVHDPFRIEAGLFATLDPASASAEEICLLADQLGDLLAACEETETEACKSSSPRVAA
ncbi:hypothetical protein [Loktanella sp. M215]|uniref:hypothetical protein n=1 Tax=Loktanella sp. M215 TaxID=2675431 RepID=UPI001F2CFEDA|nr:hypothetical protein [Loktanella sp. M215]MCF7700714.1 hypothetical protein [Loktanella sp. M215]